MNLPPFLSFGSLSLGNIEVIKQEKVERWELGQIEFATFFIFLSFGSLSLSNIEVIKQAKVERWEFGQIEFAAFFIFLSFVSLSLSNIEVINKKRLKDGNSVKLNCRPATLLICLIEYLTNGFFFLFPTWNDKSNTHFFFIFTCLPQNITDCLPKLIPN